MVISPARWAVAALLLFGGMSAADACTVQHKQAFFRKSGEGEVAHIADAVEPGQARTLYSKWCRIGDGEAIKATGPVLYFGVNDRSTEAGEASYFIMRIFRYSADTRREPLISYRRSGSWVNAFCRPAVIARRLIHVGKGVGEIAEFYRLLRNPAPAGPGQCRPFQHWMASAFGRNDLSLYGELAFLKAIPRRVVDTGVRNWSVNLLASSFRTKLRGTRSPDFPPFEVTVDGAEELIVQVLSNHRLTTFRITP